MPRENGFLSSEALYELLKIIQATTDEKERKLALELYHSHN